MCCHFTTSIVERYHMAPRAFAYFTMSSAELVICNHIICVKILQFITAAQTVDSRELVYEFRLLVHLWLSVT